MAEKLNFNKADERDLRTAWQRRLDRIPANFGSFERYLSAIGSGLLEQEATSMYNGSLQKMLGEINSADEVPMPVWTPRPEGPTCFNLMAMRDSFDQGETEESEDFED
jgi:hypothetical protein